MNENQSTEIHSLDTAVELLAACRDMESRATEERIRAEEVVIALAAKAAPLKTEGVVTYHLGDGRKVQVSTRINRTIDLDAVRTVVASWDPEDLDLAPIKETGDPTKLKRLEQTRPDLYLQLADAGGIESRPGKTGVRIVEGKK